MVRRIILSLIISLSLLNASLTQTMAWAFWTQNNYKNSWIMGTGSVGLGLLCYLIEQANPPETVEEWCEQTSGRVEALQVEYEAKVAAFEHAYKITGNDIITKNEQLENARQQWHAQIDEEALSLLGDLSSSDCYVLFISSYVQWLSTTKITLSKMHRQALQENNNLLLSKIEELRQKVSLFFLQMSFLKDYIEHNQIYFDLLDSEKKISTKYAGVVNVFIQKKDLKQVIESISRVELYPYVKFALSLNKNMRLLAQKISQANDKVKKTKLFQRSQRLHEGLCAIERLVHIDICFHKELYVYQTELIKNINRMKNALADRANQLRMGQDRTQCVRLYWNLYLASFRFYAMSDINVRVSDVEKNALKLELEKRFIQFQKNTDMRFTLQDNEIEHQLEALFDSNVTISMAEELYLQDIVERMIEDANVFLQKW